MLHHRLYFKPYRRSCRFIVFIWTEETVGLRRGDGGRLRPTIRTNLKLRRKCHILAFTLIPSQFTLSRNTNFSVGEATKEPNDPPEGGEGRDSNLHVSSASSSDAD